jgi:hypothetical protein
MSDFIQNKEDGAHSSIDESILNAEVMEQVQEIVEGLYGGGAIKTGAKVTKQLLLAMKGVIKGNKLKTSQPFKYGEIAKTSKGSFDSAENLEALKKLFNIKPPNEFYGKTLIKDNNKQIAKILEEFKNVKNAEVMQKAPEGSGVPGVVSALMLLLGKTVAEKDPSIPYEPSGMPSSQTQKYQ